MLVIITYNIKSYIMKTYVPYLMQLLPPIIIS